MTDTPYNSAWNIDMIRQRQADLVARKFEHATREEILSALVEMRVASYPFAYVMGSLDEKSWRGTTASSKLFPMTPDDESGFYVYNNETHKSDIVQIAEQDLSKTEYYLTDSLTIDDGKQLDDSFEILSVHQQAPGAYVGCGAIWMGDVRRLNDLVFEPAPSSSPDEPRGE